MAPQIDENRFLSELTKMYSASKEKGSVSDLTRPGRGALLMH